MYERATFHSTDLPSINNKSSLNIDKNGIKEMKAKFNRNDNVFPKEYIG